MAGPAHRSAPGGPGLPPRWTRGAKEAVGTSYSSGCRVWYTIAAGILTEVFYPSIDVPQLRDLQFLVTDGRTFFHDERRNTHAAVRSVGGSALGVDITSVADNGAYTLHKTVIGHPHLDAVLIRTRLEPGTVTASDLQVYVLCAPHLEIGGWHNNAEVVEVSGRKVLMAFKGQTWLALAADAPFARCSCGFVAVNDGWTDLSDNLVLDWEYDAAYDGNVALTGELDLSGGREFTLALALGDSQHRALTTLVQALATPFDEHLRTFRDQWNRTTHRFALASRLDDDRAARLFERSVNVILAHEDKGYPGALIAALSIPWGSSKGDEELGGYHLVWTRDLVNAATALLACGDTATPRRALAYLAVSQRADGGFYQNFWVDGRPYWNGVQLDEVSFPIVLAWRLQQAGALEQFDPYWMVTAAAGFLIREGPATAQERWEEAAGYSPSTLAIEIAALVCAADIMTTAGDHASAAFVCDYADFLDAHVDAWTTTADSTIVAGVPRHFVRINPHTDGDERVGDAPLILANQPPGARCAWPAKDIIDAGFLELVRYGVRDARDPLVEDSLRVVDAVLKVDTPGGPCWRRYNHDGYGQHADGSSYRGWGIGRLWPLLTGERGHYELAAGRDARPYLAAMTNFAVGIGLLPEQVWDAEPIPEKLLRFGGPTGAAIPLVWAHAEFVKLARSIVDGRVFDVIASVAARYGDRKRARAIVEPWTFRRPVVSIPAGATLRVIADRPFRLHWTAGDWTAATDTTAATTALKLWWVDVTPARDTGAPLRFTFYWTDTRQWDGRDFTVGQL